MGPLALRSDQQVDRGCRPCRQEADSCRERTVAGTEDEGRERGDSPARRRGRDGHLSAPIDGLDDRGRRGRVPAPRLGGTLSAGDGVERLLVRRHDDLNAAVIRLPADGTLEHGRSRISRAADMRQEAGYSESCVRMSPARPAATPARAAQTPATPAPPRRKPAKQTPMTRAHLIHVLSAPACMFLTDGGVAICQSVVLCSDEVFSSPLGESDKGAGALARN
jgi:hypothetical protein